MLQCNHVLTCSTLYQVTDTPYLLQNMTDISPSGISAQIEEIFVKAGPVQFILITMYFHRMLQLPRIYLQMPASCLPSGHQNIFFKAAFSTVPESIVSMPSMELTAFTASAFP